MPLSSTVRRLVVAALGGGVLMFLCGAVAHVGLGLESRAMRALPGEGPFRDTLRAMPLTPGMYQYPSMAAWEGGDGDADARDRALAAARRDRGLRDRQHRHHPVLHPRRVVANDPSDASAAPSNAVRRGDGPHRRAHR